MPSPENNTDKALMLKQKNATNNIDSVYFTDLIKLLYND